MRYILTIIITLFISTSIYAENVTEQDYIDQAKLMASKVLVSKFYLTNGKYGYNITITGHNYLYGHLEAKSSELCGKKGYVVTTETVVNATFKRQIIQCNE